MDQKSEPIKLDNVTGADLEKDIEQPIENTQDYSSNACADNPDNLSGSEVDRPKKRHYKKRIKKEEKKNDTERERFTEFSGERRRGRRGKRKRLIFFD